MMLSSDDVARRTLPVAVDLAPPPKRFGAQEAGRRAATHTQKSNFALRRAKRLQRALARVVVKLDLASPEAAHHAPAMARTKIFDLCFRHSLQDSQFHRLRDEIFRFVRQCCCNLRREGWQMLVHNIVDLPVDFAAYGCAIFSGRRRQSRWWLSFSIQFFSQSKMRFAAGGRSARVRF